MEYSSENGTYSILYRLHREKGLLEAFIKKEKPDLISELWNLILTGDYKVFINLTNFIICLEDATYQQMFSKVISATGFNEPIKVIKVLASPSNGNFYKTSNKKTVASIKTRKFEENHYDFLIVQNKLTEAQEKLKTELNCRISELEVENNTIKEENARLKTKLGDIGTIL